MLAVGIVSTRHHSPPTPTSSTPTSVRKRFPDPLTRDSYNLPDINYQLPDHSSRLEMRAIEF